jgi:hypothetical protein
MRPKHVIRLNAPFWLVAVQNRWTSRERPLISAQGSRDLPRISKHCGVTEDLSPKSRFIQYFPEADFWTALTGTRLWTGGKSRFVASLTDRELVLRAPLGPGDRACRQGDARVLRRNQNLGRPSRERGGRARANGKSAALLGTLASWRTAAWELYTRRFRATH